MNILKRLKCRFTRGHQYGLVHSALVDLGRSKLMIYKCSCGSEKVKVL